LPEGEELGTLEYSEETGDPFAVVFFDREDRQSDGARGIDPPLDATGRGEEGSWECAVDLEGDELAIDELDLGPRARPRWEAYLEESAHDHRLRRATEGAIVTMGDLERLDLDADRAPEPLAATARASAENALLLRACCALFPLLRAHEAL